MKEKIALPWLSKNKIDILYVALLLIIATLTHWTWFRFGNILSAGDIWFWYMDALREFPLAGGWISTNSFGVLNIEPYKFVFTFPWSLLSMLNLQFVDILRITHLIPIAILGFISPYVLLRSLTKEKNIAFAVALFYGAATPFIIRQYSGHLSIAFVVAITPLLLSLLIAALEKNTPKKWIIFTLLYSVSLCYEPRIIYITSIILICYFVFFYIRSIKKYFYNILLSIMLLLGLNLFWCLPIFMGGFGNAIHEIASRGLFASAHFSISRSFAMFEPYWTGRQPEIFTLQPINWYFWIVPLITVAFLLLRPSHNHTKKIMFFSVIWFIGLFLTKQANFPFPDSFQWLRENFPGFLTFRSGSKFWFVVSLGYLGLLGYGLLELKQRGINMSRKLIFKGILLTIIIVSLFNLKALVTNKFGGMFVERAIPSDYLILKDFVKSEKAFYRTFWTPINSRWAYFLNEKPIISNASIIVKKGGAFLPLELAQDNWPTNEEIMKIFNIKSAQTLFDLSSIKYIVVPIRDYSNDNDFFIFYGGEDNINIREWYISALDEIKWLKKIDIGTKELVVYENENYKAHIYTDKGLDYVQANTTEFSDLGDNTKLYLNAQLNPAASLVESFNNVIIPITFDQAEVDNFKKDLAKCEIKLCVDSVNNKIDEYARGSYFKDYKLQIPFSDEYSVYFKDDVAMDLKDIKVKVNDNEIVLDREVTITTKNNYKYFGKIKLDESEYNLDLLLKNKQLEFFSSDSLVFVAENNKSDITLPTLEYKQINPTKYVINVLNATESFPLVFSESYHPDWSLFAKADLDNKSEGQFVSENNQGTIQNKNLDPGHFYDIYFRKDVLKQNHFQANNFQNGWWVDLPELENQGRVVKNADGTYSFQLIIEFTPQKYFYIGLFISSLTLIGCLGYLGYDFHNERRKKLIAPTQQFRYTKHDLNNN